MALSNTERQRRYKAKAKKEIKRRLELRVPFEISHRLGVLAKHRGCTKTAVIEQLIQSAWETEVEPTLGLDADD